MRRDVLIVMGASLLAFSLSVGNDFTFDDRGQILQHGAASDSAGLTDAFRTGVWEDGPFQETGLYRPAPAVFFWLNSRIFGLQPVTIHLAGILLNAICSCCLMMVLFVLTRNRAVSFLGALIFGVHPVHGDAVYAAVGCSELLAGFFVLVALWCFSRGRREGRPFLFMGAAGLCFLLAMFSKESAVAFPGIALLCDIYLHRKGLPTVRGWKRLVAPYVLFSAIISGYLAAKYAAIGSLVPAGVAFFDNPLASVGAGIRLPMLAKIIWRIAKLVVFPVSLSPDYSHSSIPLAASWNDAEAVCGLIVLGAVMLLAALSYFKRTDLFLFIGFIFIPYLPASNLIVPVGVLMAERTLYVPLSGAAALMAGLLCRLFGMAAGSRAARTVAAVAGIFWVGGLFSRSVLRAGDFSDDLALFRSSLDAFPSNVKIRSNLGAIYLSRGDAEMAEAEFEKALDVVEVSLPIPGDIASLLTPIDENFLSRLHTALGEAKLRLQKTDEAIPFLEKAVRLCPVLPNPYYYLGMAWARKGDGPKARGYLDKAIALSPPDSEVQSMAIRKKSTLSGMYK